MDAIIDLILSNGYVAVILGFFIWKDMTLNNNILKVLTELRTIMKTVTAINTKGE